MPAKSGGGWRLVQRADGARRVLDHGVAPAAVAADWCQCSSAEAFAFGEAVIEIGDGDVEEPLRRQAGGGPPPGAPAGPGLATCPPENAVHAIIGTADSRMYAVKSNGRGKVRGA